MSHVETEERQMLRKQVGQASKVVLSAWVNFVSGG